MPSAWRAASLLALDYDYPQSFYLSAEGFILVKTPQGKFETIAKTDNC